MIKNILVYGTAIWLVPSIIAWATYIRFTRTPEQRASFIQKLRTLRDEMNAAEGNVTLTVKEWND